MTRTLRLLEGNYSITRLPPDSEIPPEVLQQPFFTITRTDEEVSIVCSEEIPISALATSPGWCGLRFEGTLDFSELGILAALARVMAEAQISIFAISTYDTDYIFFKCEHLDKAAQVLRDAGYRVIR